MTGESIRASMAGVERRLNRLREALADATVEHDPALEQAAEDLGIALEELHVALEELETSNEELAASKDIAEQEGLRYQELFRLVPAACLVTDAHGVIEEANEAAERLLGRPLRYLLGKPLSALIAASDRSRFFQLLDALADLGEENAEEYELRLERSGHPRIDCGISIAPIIDVRRRRTGARWLLRDLTQQHQQERDRAERGHREAYRHIAGGVIHHVNNLLGSIRGNAEIIAGSPEVAERALRAARRIHEATHRGEQLTKQLLAFSRIGRRNQETQAVNQLVREACEIAGEMMPASVRIVTDLTPTAPEVDTDALAFYQATLGLLFNARDALAEGGEITVTTRIVALDAHSARELELRPGPYVAISITDSGPGMDAETRDRAREPFFSTKPIGSAFGLGLSTSEAIVRETEGGLELCSHPGQGTVATIYLPSS